MHHKQWGSSPPSAFLRCSGRANAVHALLLENGAEPNYCSYESPLLALVRSSTDVAPQGSDQRLDCARLLLDAGADLTATLPDVGAFPDGRPALHLAVELEDRSTQRMFELLVGRGANVHARDRVHGRNPLHVAVMAEHPAAVRLLLMAGADPTAEDQVLFEFVEFQCNGTPSLLASYNVNWEVIRLLMSFGAPAPRHRGGPAPSAANPNDSVTLGVFLDSVEGMRPLQIAVGSRLYAEARCALHHGWIDTAGCSLNILVAAANNLPPPEMQMGLATLAVCTATVRLVHDAMSPWSTNTHQLYHGRFRDAVQLVMLAEIRLRDVVAPEPLRRLAAAAGTRKSTRQRQRQEARRLPGLPHLMWELVCSFLVRRDWPVNDAVNAGKRADGYYL